METESSSKFAKADTIDLIDELRFVPTGDNSQHWEYIWNNDHLEIYLNQDKAEHFFNQNNHSVLLSFGCLLGCLHISSIDQGFQYQIEYSYRDNSNNLYARVNFHKSKPQALDIAKEIPFRETNRYPYSKEPVSRALIDDIVSAFGSSKCDLHVIDSFSKPTLKKLITSELFLWRVRKAFLDTTKWIRYSNQEKYKSRDGFSLANIRISKLESYAVKLLRKFEFLYYFLPKMGLKVKLRLDQAKTLLNTGSFVCFSADDHEDTTIIEAGKMAYFAWLKFHQAGYTAQPMTTSSLFNSIAEEKGIPEDPNWQSYAKDLNAELRKEFQLGDQKILWMFRVGKAKRLTENKRTVRKRVLELIHFKD